MVRGCISHHTMTNLYCRYYGRSCSACGSFTVSINGSTPERMNASGSVDLDQRMIWSNTSLGTGRHTVTITHDDDRLTARLYLDFFRSVINEVR